MISILWIYQLAAAEPTDRFVRIFVEVPDSSAPHNVRRLVTGDTVPADSLITILFLVEPCQLNVAGAENMHRAWQRLGAYQLGCWYPTQDDHWVFVGQLSQLNRVNPVYWESYPRAMLHADGSATIIEPHYDSDTFDAQISGRKTEELPSHLHERP